MTKLSFHIVGDKFSEFAMHDNVVTVSRAEDIVERSRHDPNLQTMFVVGQGVADERLAALKARIAAAGLQQAVCVLQHEADRADPRATHKQHRHNVLISAPRRLDEDSFAANLMIDDRCADMSDHVTGQHVQGMVLIEAARQMFLAVTEMFFLPADVTFYFVINKFDVNYYAFVFPTKLEIRYGVISRRIDPRGTFGFEANIGFWQAGLLASEVVVTFTAYDADFQRKREIAKAAEVAGATLVEVDAGSILDRTA